MKINNIDIILASGSPRRHELMEGMRIPFRLADKYGVDEIYPAVLNPHDVPEFLAKLKSESYPFQLKDNQILITADTVVIHKGRVIGKPKDREEAIATLHSLSGSKHEVITGIMIRNHLNALQFSDVSKVFFSTLIQEDIEYYVDTYHPFDKAGAYGIQEWIGYIGIERIEGSFYNVMGLPTHRLYAALTDFVKTNYPDNQ